MTPCEVGLGLQRRWENVDPTLYVLSNTGNQREHNEDCAVALDLRIASEHSRSLLLLAVADGIGGCEAGEVASRMAVQSIVYAVNAHTTAMDGSGLDATLVLDDGFRIANKAILDASRRCPELKGMGTTMTAVLLQEGRLTVGHVGDTRAYLVGSRGVARLSRDHSVVQEKIDSGILTAEQARSSNERNQLTRALGINESVTCDIVTELVRPDDSILLCSDGLHSSFRDGELASQVLAHQSAKEVCESLVSRALQLDGSDNITAVCKKIPLTPVTGTCVPHKVETCSRRRSLLAALLGLSIVGICFLAYAILVSSGYVKSVNAYQPAIASSKSSPQSTCGRLIPGARKELQRQRGTKKQHYRKNER